MRSTTAIILVFGLLIANGDARAAVYKCVDAEGVITYSQAPCPDNPETVTVQGVSTGSNDEDFDCRHANRFALETARQMRGGMYSSDLFDKYGGIDALSKGSINLINFVYRYQANTTVSTERIAGFATTMCESGSLAGVGCAELPVSFTDSFGGCAADIEAVAADTPVNVPQQTPPSQATAPAPVRAADPNDTRSSDCRRQYMQKIDALDARMRSGYSSAEGERFREQRRQLRQQMSRC